MPDPSLLARLAARLDDLNMRAEALWEEIGGQLCICQNADVPHWCESCQRRIQTIREAFNRAARLVGVLPAPERRLIATWQARVADMERASDGYTWQGEITEIRRCIDDLAALLVGVEPHAHVFNSRTIFESGDDRDIWCKDCEYHRDHPIHAARVGVEPQETTNHEDDQATRGDGS